MKFHRKLGHTWISGLSCPESTEAGVAIDFVKGADLVSAIHVSTAIALWGEVGMVKDVEILHSELQPVALGNVDELGSRHIHVPRTRQTKEILADIAEATSRNRASGQKCGDIKPALAGHGHIGTGG